MANPNSSLKQAGSDPLIPKASLSGIPREIRDAILGYCLRIPKVTDWQHQQYMMQVPANHALTEHVPAIRFDRNTNKAGVAAGIRDAQILRVNKQLHEEGKEILYGQNRFSIHLAFEPQYLYGNLADVDAVVNCGVDLKSPLAKRIRHWEVVLATRCVAQPRDFNMDSKMKHAIWTVSHVLASVPRIIELRVRLRNPNNQSWVQPLGILRNVRKLVLPANMSTNFRKYLGKLVLNDGQTLTQLESQFDLVQSHGNLTHMHHVDLKKAQLVAFKGLINGDPAQVKDSLNWSLPCIHEAAHAITDTLNKVAELEGDTENEYVLVKRPKTKPVEDKSHAKEEATGESSPEDQKTDNCA